MIGMLSGVLRDKQPPWLLVDVQGVGYEVQAPMTTFYNLPAEGEKINLFTHLVVREDAQLLYGFGSASDRTLFRTLIKVNGVGPRMALTILSGMDANSFAACVQAGDTAGLIKLPGIGKKTAERLIVEMRDKLTDSVFASGAINDSMATTRVSNAVEEAVSALIALGYKAPDASKMVRGIETKDLSTQEIIRAALQGVG
ncbi:MAG: Holliday junction branch migration protein RuvA [Gammaproteobacteria bacterium]